MEKEIKTKVSNVKKFMREKSIEALTGRDYVWSKVSKKGLPPRAMFHYTEVGLPTLYYGQKKDDTTYISIPNNVFDTIDEGSTTVRDNFNIKNNIVNTLVAANAYIEDLFPGDARHIHQDLLLLKVCQKEKSIDWRYFDLGSSKNPIYQYIHSGTTSNSTVSYMLSLDDEDKLCDPDTTAKIEALEDSNSFDWFNAVCITREEKEKVEKESEVAETPEEAGVKKGETKEEEPKKSTEKVLEELEGIIDTSYVKETVSPSRFLKPDPVTVSSDKELLDQVNYLAKRLGSKLHGVYGKENCESPTKRVNIRNFVREKPKIFKRKRDTVSGKKVKMNIVVDCSGSMAGRYIQNASALCMIVSKIAREQKTITGKIILSAGEGSIVCDIADSPTELFDRMKAFSGSEGIERTFTDHQKIISKGNINICVTDAQITDSKINKAKYEAKNIFMEGIYIGKVSDESKISHEEHMNQFFSRSKILDNIEDTIEYLISTVV